MQQPLPQLTTNNNNNKATTSKVDKDTLFRTTNACDACRIRKRKCDGKHPCSYCVAKNQTCEFSQKKKRGPKKRKIDETFDEDNSSIVIVDPSPKEADMADLIEGFKYLELCWNHVRICGFTNKSKIHSPSTTAIKVQAYSAVAYAARLCGDKVHATTYINQARLLAGTIFDTPDMDAVAALMMMCHYSLLTLDLPRSAFYSAVASNLAKIVPSGKFDMKVGAFCQLTNILSDSTLPKSQKITTLQTVSKNLMPKLQLVAPDKATALANIIEFHASTIQILGFNTFYPESTYASKAFHLFDDVVISEEARLRLFGHMNQILFGCYEKGVVNHANFAKVILIPSYRAVVNWKSGHIGEAIENAIHCLAGLQVLDNSCIFGLLSHFPQVCVLGSVVKMLLEQGQVFLAKQLGDKIKSICNVMKPDLDFMCQQVDELMESVSPVTISSHPPPIITSLPTSIHFPATPLSFPSTPLPFVDSPSTPDHDVIVTYTAEEPAAAAEIIPNDYLGTFSVDEARTVPSPPAADTSSSFASLPTAAATSSFAMMTPAAAPNDTPSPMPSDVFITNDYLGTFSADEAHAVPSPTDSTSLTILTSLPGGTPFAPTPAPPNATSSPTGDITTTWFNEEGAELDVNLVDDILLSITADDDVAANSFFAVPCVDLQG